MGKTLGWAVKVKSTDGKDLMMVFPTREEAVEIALKEGGYLVELIQEEVEEKEG
ncbi:hypothetical protein [Thermus tengchongensis]|uniref:hypothetical protein n=1 Tax=Thermus tengchongensis TaxID=1214928 RepID=UPI000B1CBA23|nr:hypothetical protein [Thermus tengchongensis]